jgi:hypothetical protein
MVIVAEEPKTFASPLRKLVRFFHRSRDSWKEKCRQAKVALKRVKNEAYALRKSRDEWKRVAKQREQELEQLQRELDDQKKRSVESPTHGTAAPGRSILAGR